LKKSTCYHRFPESYFTLWPEKKRKERKKERDEENTK
jgi:hypothetical protein